MSTETYSPSPGNSSAEAPRQVVKGEVISRTDEHPAFIANALDNHSAPKKSKKSTKEAGASASNPESNPGDVKINDLTTLEDILSLRNILGTFKDEEERAAETDLFADKLSPKVDENGPVEQGKIAVERKMIKKLLSIDDDGFYSMIGPYIVSHNAHLDPKPEPKTNRPLSERLKGLIAREPNSVTSREKRSEVSTGRELRRHIKKLDSRFDGLIGEIAETGTKSAYLDKQKHLFIEKMDAYGGEIGDKHRDKQETQTIRGLIDIKDLADRKGLEGDDRKIYEDQLVETFHNYVKLSDEEREDFHNTLDSRYAIARELKTLDGQVAKSSTVEKREKTPVLGRLKRALGTAATTLASGSKARWDARKAKSTQDSRDGRHEEDESKTTSDERSARIRAALSRLSPVDIMARRRTKRDMREFDLSNMTSEERTKSREKENTRKTVISLGVITLAAVGAGLYLNKYGFDLPNGRNHSGGVANGSDMPTSHSSNGVQPVEPGVTFGPEIPDTGVGNSILSRHELFDGSNGGRHLSTENAERLNNFLGHYNVKASDDQGVWGISEKYLHAQGVKNPTVFETDAVKDYILQHSSLTDSSIIQPGDTIVLK